MADLFQYGEFKASSGEMLGWKIEVDALTDGAIKALAQLIVKRYQFDHAYSVPRGGDRLAASIVAVYNHSFYVSVNGKKLATPRTRPVYDRVLLVDDVLTTGRSMDDMRDIYRDHLGPGIEIQGVVIFNRNPGLMPWWIDSIFNLSTELDDDQ